MRPEMHFTSITATLVTALMASPVVNTTVFLANRQASDGSEEQVAWTNGTPDPCSGFTAIVGGTANSCGINFNVDGTNGPFQFEGCGGVGLSLEHNDQFNSNCVFQKGAIINCPVPATIGAVGNGRFACS
ncbi:hypothetical protein B0T17DRAFT_616004 [Bombardia bombarda]|uniref:Uncharacterized protein n=1 Tax=Bombardia bombarda TaxID=252184 RepID=A0AA40C9E7_9PEZI|nr:hypothetical protein B0T17DRAFT_616004 [Bombardia bombarda]